MELDCGCPQLAVVAATGEPVCVSHIEILRRYGIAVEETVRGYIPFRCPTTDRDKLLTLLAEFGIDPDFHKRQIALYAQRDGVGGSDGCVCSFRFEPSGEFIGVNVWEDCN